MFFSTSYSQKEAHENKTIVSFAVDKNYRNKQASKHFTSVVEEPASLEDQKEVFSAVIDSPKRESLLMSPSALIQVGASPMSSRYQSMRRLDFGLGSEKNQYSSTKRLNFFK